LESGDRIARVRQAVAELPDRQRLAVILHRYQGLSHKEIAHATGWSQGAVESCLVRAYENLRNSLTDMRLE
jgi:RNA polymerase sigma-70 factor, ECF subfamily